MTFHVTLERAEDGWIVAECPALPGRVSQGKTEEEAIANVKEAIIAWLWAEDQKSVLRLPKDKLEESIIVAVYMGRLANISENGSGRRLPEFI